MFKIIEDESVPRGTVRFEPVLDAGVPQMPPPWLDHNVYVNPDDVTFYQYGIRHGGKGCEYYLWRSVDSITLEAVGEKEKT